MYEIVKVSVPGFEPKSEASLPGEWETLDDALAYLHQWAAEHHGGDTMGFAPRWIESR